MQHQAKLLAILCNKGDTCINTVVRVLDLHLFAVDIDVPTVAAVCAYHGTHHFGAAGADHSREAYDFALVHRKIDFWRVFRQLQVFDFQHHITDGTFLAVIEHIYRAAYHVLCDLGNRRIMIFVGEGADHRTIADYRNAIRDLDNFVQEVGNVDDTNPHAGNTPSQFRNLCGILYVEH